MILAMGLAIFVTPSLERHPAGTRRWLILTLPLLVAAVAIQATLIFGGDRLKRWPENDRPLPPPGTPNVLLIVLDTVRRGSPEPLRLWATNHSQPGAIGGTQHPLRRGPCRGPLDPRLACHPVHGPLAAPDSARNGCALSRRMIRHSPSI